MTRSRWILIAAGVLLAIQLVPVPRTNPPVESAMPAPPEVQAILDRSCMDCHSHATRWPWYSRVAPLSWLVAYDVAEGREHLNLSRWESYRPKTQRNKTEEIGEVIEEGEMPLPAYLWAHPEAELSAEDQATLRAWSEARAAELGG
jgi:hypothetical protein